VQRALNQPVPVPELRSIQLCTASTKACPVVLLVMYPLDHVAVRMTFGVQDIAEDDAVSRRALV